MCMLSNILCVYAFPLCSGIGGKHSYCDEYAVEFSALSCINHWNSDFGNSFTVHFVVNDEASDDRADKCSISSYYCHNDRRYSIAKQRMYAYACI